MLLTAVHIDDNEITNDSVISNLQHSTEKSKDERVNEWMLFNFKYRLDRLLNTGIGWAGL